MQFNKGMLAVLIIVFGLISSCLFGVFINVNQNEVPKDTDNYITDITGLFSTSSKDKAYVDYNPALNFNGYSVGNGEYLYSEDAPRSTVEIQAPPTNSTYIEYGHGIFYTDRDAYYITTTNTSTLYYTNGAMTGTEFGPFYRTSDTEWTWGQIIADTTSFKIVGPQGTTYHLYFKNGSQLTGPTSSTDTFSYTIPATSMAKLSVSGTDYYILIDQTTTVDVTTTTVTLKGTTYATPNVYISTDATQLSYTRSISYEYVVATTGYELIDVATLSGTHSGTDIETVVSESMATEGKNYGRIKVYFGSGTMSDGTNTYPSSQYFYMGETGWVNEHGSLSQMTFTPSVEIRVYGETYYTYPFATSTTESSVYAESVVNPISLHVIRNNGSNYNRYYYIPLADDNTLTIEKTPTTVSVNGTTVSTGDDTVVSFNFTKLGTGNYYVDYMYDWIITSPFSNAFSHTHTNGTVLTEYSISYGNGIPSDEDYAIYMITTSDTCTLTDASGTLTGTSFGPYIATSDSTWEWGARTATPSLFSISGNTGNVFMVTSIAFSRITISTVEYEMTIPAGTIVLKLTSSGTDTYLAYTADTVIERSGNDYEINGVSYSDIDYIEYATLSGEDATYLASIKDFAVRFTPSNTGNNYPISYELTDNRTESRDITDYTTEGTNVSGKPYFEHKYGGANDGVYAYQYYTDGWSGTYSYISLKDVLEQESQYALNSYASIDKIKLVFPIEVRKVRLSHVYYQDPNFDYTFVRDYENPKNFITIIKRDQVTDLTNGTLSDPYTQGYLDDKYTGAWLDPPMRIELTCLYDVVTRTCLITYHDYEKALNSSEVEDYVIAYPTSDLEIDMYGRAKRIGPWPVPDYELWDSKTVTSTNQMYIEFLSEKTTDYIDPRYGITRNEVNPTWNNGYTNGAFDLTVYLGSIDRGNGFVTGGLEVDKNVTFGFNYESNVQSRISLNHIGNGTTTATVYYYDNTDPSNPIYVPYNTIDLGSGWVAYNIRADFVNGSVSIQPIAPEGWSNFLDWNSNQEYIQLGTFMIKSISDGTTVWTENKDPVISMTYMDSNTVQNRVAIQISNTQVFLNTYGVIMIDPHVNIMNWYPNNTHFKMKFTKIASLGPTITINGTVYEISKANTIKIDGTNVNLTEFEIEFYKNPNGTFNITVSSLQNSSSATIENATDTDIRMNGAWYFTSGYYTVIQKMVKEYKWDFADGIVYGYTGVVLFMMIFIAIIGFIWWKLAPDMVSGLDIAILIGAEIILYLILA